MDGVHGSCKKRIKWIGILDPVFINEIETKKTSLM